MSYKVWNMAWNVSIYINLAIWGKSEWKSGILYIVNEWANQQFHIQCMPVVSGGFFNQVFWVVPEYPE